ncbi:MAG: EVE domain-containing protein [Pseudobdellovibrio sp.]
MKSQQKKYWLMKSEPDVFSIDNLKKDKTTWWEGVRNYQARNFMIKDMNENDGVLFYHSNATPPGLAGLAVVSQKAKPDPSQFNKKSEYFDPKATPEKPNWFCVEVEYKKTFKNFITLENLKTDKNCADLLVIKKGQRLSIQPISEKDFLYLSKLGLE